jgi:putative FmdB family regulatory protein
VPIYEYRCTQCDHRFERLQPVGSPPEACPRCGGATRRLLGSVGLVFRGSGFYTTDYRRSQDGASGSEVQRSESKAEPQKESKPAST